MPPSGVKARSLIAPLVTSVTLIASLAVRLGPLAAERKLSVEVTLNVRDRRR